MLRKILKKLRKENLLSVKLLSEKLGFSDNTIYNAERGIYSQKTLDCYNVFFREYLPESLSLVCSDCKTVFVSCEGLQKYCPVCRKKNEMPKQRVHRYTYVGMRYQNPNPVTALTVQIVCMYHLEGQNASFIAGELMRPVGVIRAILLLAKRNGTYEKYRKYRESGYDLPENRYREFYRIILSGRRRERL